MGSIETAILAVEGLRAKELGWGQPQRQASALPVEAHGLADVLRRPEIAESAAKYESASEEASVAQDLHKRYARTAAFAGFLAAVVAALMLLLGLNNNTGPIGFSLGVAHGVLVIAVWYAVARLSMKKPYLHWATKRSAAERQRVEHFRSLLSIRMSPAAPKTTQLLLEYVRVFLIEEQKSWFTDKARFFECRVRRATYWRWLSALLIAAAAMPTLVAILPARAMAELPAWARAIAAWTHLPTSAAILAFLGVVGGAMQGLILSLTAISLSDRNAVAYRGMVGVLTELSGKPLQSAREAALRGEPEALERFWGALSFQLLAEQREWSAVLGNVQLLALGQLNRLGKQT